MSDSQEALEAACVAERVEHLLLAAEKDEAVRNQRPQMPTLAARGKMGEGESWAKGELQRVCLLTQVVGNEK